MPGIESISGSMKQKKGSRIVFKTFSKPSVNRSSKTETRVYLMQRKERSSSLSENEIRCRERFAQATRYFTNLTPEQKEAYAKEWKKSSYRFKGKKYATLRGFIVAKFYDLYPVRWMKSQDISNN